MDQLGESPSDIAIRKRIESVFVYQLCIFDEKILAMWHFAQPQTLIEAFIASIKDPRPNLTYLLQHLVDQIQSFEPVDQEMSFSTA